MVKKIFKNLLYASSFIQQKYDKKKKPARKKSKILSNLCNSLNFFFLQRHIEKFFSHGVTGNIRCQEVMFPGPLNEASFTPSGFSLAFMNRPLASLRDLAKGRFSYYY